MNKQDLIKRLIHEQLCINRANRECDRLNAYITEIIELDLTDVILDLMEVPADNTVEMKEKYGEKWIEQNGLFCRDGITDILREGNNTDKVYDLLLYELSEIKKDLNV